MSEDRLISCSIRLYGDEFDPVKIMSTLALDPAASWRKGERHITRSGAEVTRRTGLWSFDGDDGHAGVADAIAALLSRFAERREPLNRLPAVEKAQLSVFVGLDQTEDGTWEEFEIAPSIIGHLAELGLELSTTVSVSSQ